MAGIREPDGSQSRWHHQDMTSRSSTLMEMVTSPRTLQENGAVWWHCCHSAAVLGAAATLARTTQPQVLVVGSVIGDI